jgi:peptidoglycan/xylan/chitin deacetylase (PgdA/CDA1 family)
MQIFFDYPGLHSFLSIHSKKRDHNRPVCGAWIYLGCTFFILLPQGSSAQYKGRAGAEITTWFQDKPGAISITFDDAAYSQYTNAYPVLTKYGIKATFSIVSEWVGEEPRFSSEDDSFDILKMGWPQLLELLEQGHELAAHGYRHEKYDKLMPVPELTDKMKQIKDLIESRTHEPVLTINYPYSYASANIPEAAREAGYLFGRTGLDTINSPSPSDMYMLASHAILNENSPDSTTLSKWIGEAKGNWLILMYHHFFGEGSRELGIMLAHGVQYTYSITPARFSKQIERLVSSGCWLAPVCSVGKYIAERDNTEIQTTRSRKAVHVYSTTSLDKRVYDQPLTLKIRIPWRKTRVEGSLTDGDYEPKNNSLLINFIPGREIVLKKAR